MAEIVNRSSHDFRYGIRLRHELSGGFRWPDATKLSALLIEHYGVKDNHEKDYDPLVPFITVQDAEGTELILTVWFKSPVEQMKIQLAL